MFRKLALAITVLTSFSASAQTIERPSVKVNDECHYDIFDNLRKDAQGNIEKIAETSIVVTSVENDRINATSTQKILVSRDTEDLEAGALVYDRDLNMLERNGRKFEPALPTTFYPLVPGAEKKDVKTHFQRQTRDGETDFKVDGRASNWGKLVVPAGSFDAITITWEGWYSTYNIRYRWTGKAYREVSLSPITWCPVSDVIKNYRSDGGIWTDRTYKLTGFKN
jgi:hypothetical protein